MRVTNTSKGARRLGTIVAWVVVTAVLVTLLGLLAKGLVAVWQWIL